MKILERVLEIVTGSPRFFLLAVGVIGVVVAAYGGVDYQNIAPLHNSSDRIIVGAVCGSILLIALTIWYLEQKQSSNNIPKDKLGITITHPINNQEGRKFYVRGTIAGKLPPGYRILIFRLYEHDFYIPVGEAAISDDGKTWSAADCDIAGKAGEPRRLAAYLVGPGGIALVAYFRHIERFYRPVRDKSVSAGVVDTPYLPPIEVKTIDMIKCSEASLVRN